MIAAPHSIRHSRHFPQANPGVQRGHCQGPVASATFPGGRCGNLLLHRCTYSMEYPSATFLRFTGPPRAPNLLLIHPPQDSSGQSVHSRLGVRRSANQRHFACCQPTRYYPSTKLSLFSSKYAVPRFRDPVQRRRSSPLGSAQHPLLGRGSAVCADSTLTPVREKYLKVDQSCSQPYTHFQTLLFGVRTSARLPGVASGSNPTPIRTSPFTGQSLRYLSQPLHLCNPLNTQHLNIQHCTAPKPLSSFARTEPWACTGRLLRAMARNPGAQCSLLV